jgi:predicted negative regulator of RcsB-dependent stress response
LASYASDEEQIEALKSWWKENGNSLIVGVVLVFLILFGSRQWQSQQVAYATEASDLYQSLLDVVAVDFNQEISEEEKSTAIFFNSQLRNDYQKSIYAKYAALYMAQFYVGQDDLESAAAELQWVLDNPKLGIFESAVEELFLITRLRLARVVLSQGEAQRALDLILLVEPREFTGAYAEVEGDAYIILGQEDNAREAYQRATASGVYSVMVELKLRDLGISSETL